MTIRVAREGSAREMARQVIEEHDVTTWPLRPEVIADRESIPVEVVGGFPSTTYGALYKHYHGFKIILSAACHTEGNAGSPFVMSWRTTFSTGTLMCCSTAAARCTCRTPATSEGTRNVGDLG